jgi:hypothetical protein
MLEGEFGEGDLARGPLDNLLAASLQTLRPYELTDRLLAFEELVDIAAGALHRVRDQFDRQIGIGQISADINAHSLLGGFADAAADSGMGVTGDDDAKHVEHRLAQHLVGRGPLIFQILVMGQFET